MRLTIVLLILLSTLLLANGQQVAVGDSVSITSTAGEAQSTVVAPKLKTQCQPGRVLFSNDRVHPPNSAVSGKNLNDSPTTQPINSKFNMFGLTDFNVDWTKSKYYFEGTSDHDLVTLSNGDVLYITAAFSRQWVFPPVMHAPAPAWFADTSRCLKYDAINDGTCAPNQAFGPGARGIMIVFRSTDCGETFQYVSQMDPARELGGSCAFPQFRRNWFAANAPTISAKPYDMGGTDGQLVKVDKTNNRVYMTFQCVGYNPDGTKKPDFVLNEKDKLSKTLVGMFDGPGLTWTSFGFMDDAAWRFSIVPVSDDSLAFGYYSSVVFANRTPSGKYEFDATGVAAPVGSCSWSGEKAGDFASNPTVPVGSINSNVWANPVLTRSPGSNTLVLTFPDKFGAKGFGYRVYFYDSTTKKLAEAQDAILPATASPDNLIMHVTAVDLGTGPVLLYWYDLDSAAKTMTIRGRLITGYGQYSPDFVISKQGTTTGFPLTSGDYWFGDYKTAGGFIREGNITIGQGPFKVTKHIAQYHYYPIWIDPNGSVNYADVEYALDPATFTPNKKAKTLQLVDTPQTRWKPWGPPIQLARVRRPRRPVEMDVEPDLRLKRSIRQVNPKVRP